MLLGYLVIMRGEVWSFLNWGVPFLLDQVTLSLFEVLVSFTKPKVGLEREGWC